MTNNVLKASRVLLGLRQIDVVKRVNELGVTIRLNKTTYCQIETGRIQATDGEKHLIAQVLDMGVEELFPT